MQKYRQSRIAGEFSGWNAETIYQLDDGTKWKLVRYQYRYKYKYRPRAIIWRDGGRYYLEVDGMDKAVQVNRES